MQLKEKYSEIGVLHDSSKTYINFSDKTWISEKQSEIKNFNRENILVYQFNNREYGLSLKLIIGPSENKDFREKLFNVAKEKSIFRTGAVLSQKYSQILSISIISKEEIKEKSLDELKLIIDKKMNTFFSENGEFYTIREALKDIMSLS